MKTQRSIELHTAGDIHRANGRRITRERMDELKRTADRLESFTTRNRGGVWHHYCTARFNGKGGAA